MTSTAIDNQIMQTLTCLPEKFVVDFANGIDVVRDHIHVQQSRSGFFNRLYDGFTGQGTRRQMEINASLADGVEGALCWLTELTESLAQSNYAIVKVNERIATLLRDVTTLVHYSADTRQRLELFSESLNARCYMLTQELKRVDFEQRAERQLEQVFNKWAAGRFGVLSISGRCYVAIEELYWGDFGDFCRANNNHVRQGFLDDLVNRAIKQLNDDMQNYTLTERTPIEQWLQIPKIKTSNREIMEGITYLGDWSNSEFHPFVFSTSQAPEAIPITLPRICNSERIAQTLVSEVFDWRDS